MLSLRLTRNIELTILFIIIVTLTVSSFWFQKNIISPLDYIINVEEKKLSKWLNVMELVGDAKDSFYKIIISREKFITPVIFILDNLNRELKDLLKLTLSQEELFKVKEVMRAERRFKSAVVAYKQEIKEGYTGASAGEMEKAAIEAADEITNIAYMAVEDVNKIIKRRNKEIFVQIERTSRFFFIGLLLGMFSVMVISYFMRIALIKPIKVLTQAMERVGKGELSYRLSVDSKDEIGRLAKAFNKMSEDLEVSQENLKRAYELLNRIAEGIEEGIMLIDRNFKILWANKKIKELTKLDKEDIIGKFCYKVTHHRNGLCEEPYDICPIKEVLKTGKSSKVVHIHFDKEGNKFYAENSVYPLRNENGEITQFVHVTRDITEVQKLQEELIRYASDLEKAKEELQAKVNELERFNRLAVGRELKMIELKKKIRELEAKLREASENKES